MTSTREVILRAIRAQGDCTVKELAEAADISPVSVRHHLSNLLADGLIQAKEVRHGVGRPTHHYSLTEDAIELFPTRYLRLTNRLLVELKQNLPDQQVESLLSKVAGSMADDYAAQLDDLTLEEKLPRLVEMLNDEGFEAEIEQRQDHIIIRALSCPYYRVGINHPEVCSIDQAFIACTLSLPVERITCLLEGDSHCAFSVAMSTGGKVS
ncbi:MAG: winged helix-turn-helix transcriptional regulator [Anaerolineales bacterium]|jgi:predicted ArsR family transcriptional regulator